jgi:hypothetical protein
MFSDEGHFELRFGNQDSLTKKDVKHLEKVMAWGCFTWMGRGGLEFLGNGEMMNRIRYRRLLDEKLVFLLNQYGTSHFLQDRTPCHKAELVTPWFTERPQIKLNKWLDNSPDLNPIENVWAW